MILTYRDMDQKLVKKVAASITIRSGGPGDGQPAIVLSTGEVIDILTWNLREYQVIQATQQERQLLSEILNSESKGGESA